MMKTGLDKVGQNKLQADVVFSSSLLCLRQPFCAGRLTHLSAGSVTLCHLAVPPSGLSPPTTADPAARLEGGGACHADTLLGTQPCPTHVLPKQLVVVFRLKLFNLQSPFSCPEN